MCFVYTLWGVRWAVENLSTMKNNCKIIRKVIEKNSKAVWRKVDQELRKCKKSSAIFSRGDKLCVLMQHEGYIIVIIIFL